MTNRTVSGAKPPVKSVQIAAVAIAVAILGGWGLNGALADPPMPVSAEAQRVDYYHGTAINTPAMSRQQIGARAAAFAEATATPLAAAAVEPSKVAAAIGSLKLLPEGASRLAEKVASGEVTMREIGLLNDSSQSNTDSVAVSAGGFTTVVRLFGIPVAIAIPVAASGTPVRITGVTDGGGKGITAAVIVGGTLLHVPVASPGQSASFLVD